jgi:hypothetical protein
VWEAKRAEQFAVCSFSQVLGTFNGKNIHGVKNQLVWETTISTN